MVHVASATSNHRRHSPNGIMECQPTTAALFRLDVRELDQLAPFLSFGSDELAEVRFTNRLRPAEQ